MERKCRIRQDEIYELKELLTHTQADGKLKVAHYEGCYILSYKTNNDYLKPGYIEFCVV